MRSDWRTKKVNLSKGQVVEIVTPPYQTGEWSDRRFQTIQCIRKWNGNYGRLIELEFDECHERYIRPLNSKQKGKN